jgi:hypothetical protein
MSYLLDACVLSELRKPMPNKGIVDWVDEVTEEAVLSYAIDYPAHGQTRTSNHFIVRVCVL